MRNGKLTTREVDELLQSGKKLTPTQVKMIGSRISMEDVAEKAEAAKVTPAWLVRQRKRYLRARLKRLGRLKRGQVYTLRWPKVGWVNGHPTTWLTWKGQTAAERWADFLKANPPERYCFSGCLPEEASKGPGMEFEVLVERISDLAGVECGGCGRSLEEKGLDPERHRTAVKKARKRKPTKPRDLLSLAQVVRQMKEQDARMKKLR